MSGLNLTVGGRIYDIEVEAEYVDQEDIMTFAPGACSLQYKTTAGTQRVLKVRVS